MKIEGNDNCQIYIRIPINYFPKKIYRIYTKNNSSTRGQLTIKVFIIYYIYGQGGPVGEPGVWETSMHHLSWRTWPTRKVQVTQHGLPGHLPGLQEDGGHHQICGGNLKITGRKGWRTSAGCSEPQQKEPHQGALQDSSPPHPQGHA